MKCIYKILVVCVSFFALGCATTNQPLSYQMSNTNHDKRPLVSDHHLMLAMLNRPITADQQLMRSFTRDNTQPSALFVNPIAIIGSEQLPQTSHNSVDEYSKLIAKDRHAVSIRGPY